jgi:tetratricopeptide (TPR) repeat protein/uncharacterized membrane protein YhaH (DUF805 family)
MTYSQVLFSFQGRIPRSTFWLKFYVPVMLGYLVSWFLDVKLGTSFQPGNVGVIYLLFALAAIYPSLAVNVKRAHDRGRSGWFILLFFIPLLNIWPVIELVFLRGTMGPNQYGPDTAAGQAPNGAQAAGLAEQAMTRRSDWKPLAVLVVLLLIVVGFVLWRYLPSGKSGKEIAATPTIKTPAATATVPKTSVPKASTSAPDQPKTLTTAKAQPITKPPSNAAEYLQLGINEKDPQKKIALYTKAIELDPKQAMAFNNRGLAYFTKKDYDQALKDYDQAIVLKPDFALAYNNRGDAYYQRKEYDRAQADYSKAIGLKPDYDLAYYNRGLTYYEQKNYDQAINDFNNAISLKANFAAAYNSRGNAYFRKQEFDLAINDYNKVVEVSPNWAVAYSNRGNAWFEKKEFDQALKEYDQAIAKNPNYAWAYYRRAVIYNQKGDGEQARQNYAKAKALNPKLPELVIK